MYMYIYIYITKLASKEILYPSNKIHREVGRGKDLPAHLYTGHSDMENIVCTGYCCKLPVF